MARKLTDYERPETAANLVGIAPSTVKSAIERGDIETVVLPGGTRLVLITDVEHLRDNPRKPGRKAQG